MNVELVPAAPADLATLRHLVQLYLYDFSVFLCDDPGMQIDEQGLYDPGFDLPRYLSGRGHWAYLARVDAALAGFVLISDRLRYRNGPGRIVDEFFVLRCYRRRGVGRALATQVFDSFRGYWEVAQIAANTPAQAFWRAVIAGYTSGSYEELIGDHGEVWQLFDNAR